MQPDLRATSAQCHYDLQLLHAGAWNEEQLILHSLWKNGCTPVLQKTTESPGSNGSPALHSSTRRFLLIPVKGMQEMQGRMSSASLGRK